MQTIEIIPVGTKVWFAYYDHQAFDFCKECGHQVDKRRFVVCYGPVLMVQMMKSGLVYDICDHTEITSSPNVLIPGGCVFTNQKDAEKICKELNKKI